MGSRNGQPDVYADSLLFTPLQLRTLTLRNRVFVSSMCQYSAENGVPQSWHLVHLGSRAVGGAGVVMTEATAVMPTGRITPACTGLWNEEQMRAWQPIAAFIKSQGAAAGIQLAHAGRKASCEVPWMGGHALTENNGGWPISAPSPIPFSPESPMPEPLSMVEMQGISERFVRSAELAVEAGFNVLELHMAHGYLLHEYLSPLSNQRNDSYGGSLENRMRFPLEVAQHVRSVWPEKYPLFVRISATDWVEGGWDLEQSVIFASELKKLGVDIIDCSSGGLVSYVRIPSSPGYQVPFAQVIRSRAHIMTGAVGMITDAEQAEMIVREERADVVFLAREMLRDPYWPLHAAQKLGLKIAPPKQYERAYHK